MSATMAFRGGAPEAVKEAMVQYYWQSGNPENDILDDPIATTGSVDCEQRLCLKLDLNFKLSA